MYYNHYFPPSSSIELQKMLNLIVEIVRYEAVTELTFDYLKVLAPNEGDKILLQRILDEEREHFKILKEMFFYWTRESPGSEPPTFEAPKDYISGIEEIFYQKVQTITIYKKIKKYLPIQDMREHIRDFIYDELSHLSILNLIIIKDKTNERLYEDNLQKHLNYLQFYS